MTSVSNHECLFRNQIRFEAVIYHGEGSKAEGLPAKIRVIAPSYVKYLDSDTFETNYTQGGDGNKVSILFSIENLLKHFSFYRCKKIRMTWLASQTLSLKEESYFLTLSA